MTRVAAGGGVRPADGQGRKRTVITWTVILTVLVIGEFLVFVHKPAKEVPLYMLTVWRLTHGEQIYQHELQPFTYPPLFALPFVPLAHLPRPLLLPAWFLVNLAVLAIIFWRLRRRLAPVLDEPGGRVSASTYWALVGLLSARFLLTPLEYQSHDLIVFCCGMLAVDAWCGMRQGYAGVAAGLGAALKATPLLFAPLFVWQRRWTALATMLAAIVLLSVLPDLLYPAPDGTSWFVVWYRTHIASIRPGESAASPNSWHPWAQVNQALAGTLHRLCTYVTPTVDQVDVSLINLGPQALRATILMAQLAVAGWLFWVTRSGLTWDMPEKARQFQRLGEGAALLTAMPLLSPTSVKTHFCVLLVPIAFCLADFLYRRRDVLVGTALLIVAGVGCLTVKGVVGYEVGTAFLARGSLTWCAVALFLATGRILMQRTRLAQPATAGQPSPLALTTTSGLACSSGSLTQVPANALLSLPSEEKGTRQTGRRQPEPA